MQSRNLVLNCQSSILSIKGEWICAYLLTISILRGNFGKLKELEAGALVGHQNFEMLNMPKKLVLADSLRFRFVHRKLGR